MTDNKLRLDLGVLEEDDEFEEFPQDAGNAANVTNSLWEDSWEDDIIEEDFSTQLRNEKQKISTQPK